MVGDLADRLEAESLVSHGLAWTLRRPTEGADRVDLFVPEAETIIGHDQRGLGQQELGSSPLASVTSGVVGVLEELEWIASGVLLTHELLPFAALVQALERAGV